MLGLIAGAVWLSSSGQPAWMHAVRIGAVLLIVPAVAQRLVNAIARRHGRGGREALSVRRLVASKAVLIVIALAVTMVLQGHVAGLDWYVAGWLVLMITLGGPVIHHRLLTGAPAGPHPRTATDPADDAAA